MKIWAFGDSFTAPFDEHSLIYKEYLKYLGRKPKTYDEILSEKLGCTSINLGKRGADNYTILEIFSNNVQNFYKDDLIIIGWSNINRFRLVDNDFNWRTMIPGQKNNLHSGFDTVSEKTIDEIFVNRELPNYAREVNSWISMIKYFLKNNIVISWTPFPWIIDGFNFNGITSLKMETDGVVNDGHYGEVGNKYLSDFFYNVYIKLLNTNGFI